MPKHAGQQHARFQQAAGQEAALAEEVRAVCLAQARWFRSEVERTARRRRTDHLERPPVKGVHRGKLATMIRSSQPTVEFLPQHLSISEPPGRDASGHFD
jgi:hypothetical protein